MTWLDSVDAYRHLTPGQLARRMPVCVSSSSRSAASRQACEYGLRLSAAIS